MLFSSDSTYIPLLDDSLAVFEEGSQVHEECFLDLRARKHHNQGKNNQASFLSIRHLARQLISTYVMIFKISNKQ
jgi:hypothetical protein